ncbi:MAG TPA: RluA family pseudouridine synthase [Geobacteraceae bacterium]
MLSYLITEADHCRRADSFLRNLLPDAPLSYLKKLIEAGHLRVNGSGGSPETILRLGDTVTLKESSRTRGFLTAPRSPLDILYEDSWIVAFNKPAGLPMHPAAEVDDRNLVDQGTALLATKGPTAKLRPVNRLDRGTSGAVILARSSTAAGIFGRVVKEEGLEKIYLALVEGVPEPTGSITFPLKGKDAETRYRVLAPGKKGALVALFPFTGRMHQLRQHLSLIGHPILGDRRYGGSPLPDYEGFALHSFRTALTHPASNERLVIFAPLPERFLSLATRFVGIDNETLLLPLTDITLP